MRLPLTLLLPLWSLACAPTGAGAGDASVVYGVLDTEVFIFDQALVGQPAGAQDLTVDCPLGGTVHILGSTSSDATAVIDLTLSMAGCSNSGSGYDLTMDGDLAWSGSFRSSGYKALSTTSDELSVSGEVDDGPVDDTCALAVTDRGEDGEVSSVSGEWCGRDVAF